MAGVTSATNLEELADLSARLTHRFKPGFMEVLNSETTLWNLMPKNRAVGPLVEWKCHYGRNTAGGAVSETDAPSNAGSQKFITLYANYAIYVKPVEISDFMLAKDAAAGHGAARIWADETARAAADMKMDIEKALWDAQSGSSCLGIQDAIDDGSNVDGYGGKLRADYPFLAAVYQDNGGTPRALSLPLLRGLSREIRHGSGADVVGGEATFYKEDQGGGKVDLLLTSPDLEDSYEALVTANSRYPIPPASTGPADPGLTDLVYKKSPVIASRFAPSGKIFALDLSTWSIEVLPQVLHTSDGQEFETDFALIVEGRSGQSIKAFWRIYFQLVCFKPFRNGILLDLS